MLRMLYLNKGVQRFEQICVVCDFFQSWKEFQHESRDWKQGTTKTSRMQKTLEVGTQLLQLWVVALITSTSHNAPDDIDHRNHEEAFEIDYSFTI